MADVRGSGAGIGIAESSQTRTTTILVVPTGMDPVRAFYLNCRMETTLLGSSGTKGSGTRFNFHLVVDCTSTFLKFRAAISNKYPWGLYDVVEISSNQADADPIIEEVQPDDVPTDDEDDLMHTEFVIWKKPNGEEATQHDDYIAPPEFDQTDSDEREEENDMGYSESSDEARPDVHFDRDDPSLAEGTIFCDVVECRNALATDAIKTQSEFKIDKSQSKQKSSHMPKCDKKTKVEVSKV
ncbi:putative histone-lysine N-methyltransferase ATXR3 [Hordeum vulgare]|nr:putative histone-lysine N-methyltransferase ATXR3 [Hordeum vulgare]